MSAPLDEAAQNESLDLLLGTGVPASFEVALFDLHPLLGGVEMDSVGGYVRPVVANDAALFPDAAAAAQKTAAAIPFADPSADWTASGQPVPATYWVFFDASDSVTRWWYGLLATPISALSTSTNISISPTVRWNTEGN